MDRFVQHEQPTEIKILDLAAGSGEATEVSSPAGVRLSWGRIQLTAFCE
jgi:hypothetical protein